MTHSVPDCACVVWLRDLLELRVLALLALQPLSDRGVARFGQGEGPDLAYQMCVRACRLPGRGAGPHP